MSDQITDLHALGDELLAAARTAPEGRASRVVEHGSKQRAVLMALVGGTSLREHSSPGAATFHVLSGRVRLVAGSDSWDESGWSGSGTSRLVAWCPSRRSGTQWRPTRTR